MSEVHPNMALLERLSKCFPHNPSNAGDLFSDSFVLHYFNPNLPTVTGDYHGAKGLQSFFEKLGQVSEGSFRTVDRGVLHVSDELIVVTATHNMTAGGRTFEVDAVVIWRVVDGQFTEAWDIPAVFSTREVEIETDQSF
ncbi:MAG: nuclear transport factor 2 family protein [Pyrinomonadaceae bacterium]|nr:nuclear transport factor 2 family protein [Pyrinomonadaceae bacterium]